MAKNSIRDFSATASSNTDIQSVDIDENCAASGINNAIRELMADLADVNDGTVALASPQVDSLTLNGNASFGDNDKAVFGAGSDLQIYHNGNDSYVDDAGTGALILRGNSNVTIGKHTGETMGFFEADGAVSLYHDNSIKLATTSSGVSVTGTVAATSYTGDGSSLTGIDSGVIEADQWYLNAGSHTGNSTITSWARVTQTGWSKVGTGMSHSSGVFTFPSTGLYKVSLFAQFRDDQDDNMAADIEVTTNNSTYTVVIQALSGETSGQNSASAVSYFVNVTNTSNVKVRFSTDSLDSGSYIIGTSSNKIRTNVMFERIAPAQ